MARSTRRLKLIFETPCGAHLRKKHQAHVLEDWYKNFYHLDKYQACKICGFETRRRFLIG